MHTSHDASTQNSLKTRKNAVSHQAAIASGKVRQLETQVADLQIDTATPYQRSLAYQRNHNNPIATRHRKL